MASNILHKFEYWAETFLRSSLISSDEEENPNEERSTDETRVNVSQILKTAGSQLKKGVIHLAKSTRKGNLNEYLTQLSLFLEQIDLEDLDKLFDKFPEASGTVENSPKLKVIVLVLELFMGTIKKLLSVYVSRETTGKNMEQTNELEKVIPSLHYYARLFKKISDGRRSMGSKTSLFHFLHELAVTAIPLIQEVHQITQSDDEGVEDPKVIVAIVKHFLERFDIISIRLLFAFIPAFMFEKIMQSGYKKYLNSFWEHRNGFAVRQGSDLQEESSSCTEENLEPPEDVTDAEIKQFFLGVPTENKVTHR